MAALDDMGIVELAWRGVLTSGLDKLRIENMLCDTTIATSDGQSLPCHACVLAAACPVLQTSLVKIAERCYLVNIAGITCEVWKHVLQFIYTGTIVDLISDADQVDNAAAALELPLLRQFTETSQKRYDTQSLEWPKIDDDGGGDDKGDLSIPIEGSDDRPVVLQVVKSEDGSVEVCRLKIDEEPGETEEVVEEEQGAAGSDEEEGNSPAEIGSDGNAETKFVSSADDESTTPMSRGRVIKPVMPTAAAKSASEILRDVPNESGDVTESPQTPKRGVNHHECDVCGHSFRYRSALVLHSRVHTAEKPYACVECSMNFANRTILRNHMSTHKTDREIFQCDQCDKCFLTKSGLWQHRRLHSLRSGATSATTCTTCEEQFRSFDELREHLVSAHDRKMFACVECQKIFHSERALSAHVATHSMARTFTCAECGQTFDQHNALKCHQRLHAGEKRFRCPDCDAKFQTKSGLKAHSKRHSAIREQFSCTCGKVYTTLRGLHHHRLYSHKDGETDNEHQCSKCQSTFETSAGLVEHKAVEHRRKYLCGDCGNTFSTHGALMRHTLIHTGEKPFICTVCDRAFRTRGTLTAHARCHSGEKPFPCATCGACFRIKNALTIHKRIHTGERPYECTECGALFRSRTLQMAHQQRHHTPASERRHVCATCGKVFLSRSTLRDHEIRTHVDDPSAEESRRCVCNLCGKVVAHAASLRSHMYVHAKRKLFQCIQCESSFRRNSDLKRHLRQVHGYEVVPDAASVTESPADTSQVICEPVLDQQHLSEATVAF